MIVDSAVYRDGQRAAGPVPLQEALEAAREASGSGFAWIGLVEPGQDELAAVAAEFDLHPLAVEDAVNAHQRPKLEEYGDTLFVVLKTVSYDGSDDVQPGEVMLFVGAHFVVSVRHGPDAGLGDLRRHAESRPEQLCQGPGGVLHAVADLVVDRYAEALALLDERVEDVEDEVFDEHLGVDLSERIYRLKRHVVAFRRAAAPLREPMERLASPTGVPGIPLEARPFFRDVADHLAREVDHLEALDSLLDSVLDANLAQVQARLNADQRKISSWAAIGLVPTAVAGIYGMNFEHMPELGWTLGYPLALGLIVLLCTLLYRGFRRNGWL